MHCDASTDVQCEKGKLRGPNWSGGSGRSRLGPEKSATSAHPGNASADSDLRVEGRLRFQLLVTFGANAWGRRPRRGAHLTRAEVTSDILVLNHRSLNSSSLPQATCQQVRSFLRRHLPVCPRRADERRSPALTWGPLPGMHFPEKAAHVAFTAGLNVPFPRVSVTQPGFYMSPWPWAVKSLPGSELDVAALRCIWAPSVCEAALTSAQTLREPR